MNINLIAVALLLVVIAFLAYKLYSLNKKKIQSDNELIRVQSTYDTQQTQISNLETQASQAQNRVEQLSALVGELKANNASCEGENKQLCEQLAKVNDDYQSTQLKLNDANAQIASLNSTLEARDELQQKQQQLFSESSQKLENNLKLIADKLVKAGTEDLSKASKEHFAMAVNPLKEELDSFKKLIAESQEKNAQRQGEMFKELNHLQETHSTLSKQAEDLTKALRAGGKSQGMWGELQLEHVLEASGLTKGVEYLREVAGDRSKGENGRPDAIIKLPQNHNIIIDSKCSITNYTDFINASDDNQKAQALKSHINSIKNHLNELIKKDYSSYESLNSPSFVFMFLPVDNALSVALQADSSLYDTGAKNRVYLVSPSSIMPALRVVANLWVLSEQSDRMRQLVSAAEKIAKKYGGVVESLDEIDKIEHNLRDNIDTLRGRFFSGRGNLASLLNSFNQKASREFKDIDGQVIETQDPLEALEDHGDQESQFVIEQK